MSDDAIDDFEINSAILPFQWPDFGPKRKTDEPAPKKPDWLYEREWLEEAMADVATAFYAKDEERGGYEYQLDELAKVGITAEITIHGTLPELTEEQKQERDTYKAEYAAWEERNPIIDPGWANRSTPFLDKIVMGDFPPEGALTWGWTSFDADKDVPS